MQAAAGNTDEAIATVRRAQEVLGAIDNRDLLGDAYDHEAYVYLMLNRENDAVGSIPQSGGFVRAGWKFAEGGLDAARDCPNRNEE